ncbi:MAG: chemotaxis protein CheW [Candidatus Brocadiae bacterium]|nr:chemotaxis protein CheW [Candidatus Brocadiia bacterium]
MDTLKKSMNSLPGIKTYIHEAGKKAREEIDLLVFQASSENFAIPAKIVEEILLPWKYQPSPWLSQYITGVIAWQTEILAVINLEKLLKLAFTRLEKKTSHLVVVRIEGMALALESTKVIGLMSFSKESIQSIPPEIQSQPQGKFFQGYIKSESRFMLLLDLAKLIKYSLEEMQPDAVGNHLAKGN